MLKPVNRMLLVNIVSDTDVDANESSFYLPDDVATKNEYEVVSLIETAKDSKFFDVLAAGFKLLVEGHMLREVNISDQTHHLILENHVLGTVV